MNDSYIGVVAALAAVSTFLSALIHRVEIHELGDRWSDQSQLPFKQKRTLWFDTAWEMGETFIHALLISLPLLLIVSVAVLLIRALFGDL